MYSNLVLSGGALKAVVLLGAVKYLEEKDNLNLNKIMAEIKKFKFNIDEAGFLKSNLDDVFRKITREK